MTHTVGTWRQQSFAWYTDAGGEGTNQIGSTNSNPSTLAGNGSTQYRLRYLIQEYANSTIGETPVFGLQYRVDPAGGTAFGSWLPIDSDDTYFTAVSSANVTDGATTTQQIGAGTFRDGEFSYVDATALAPTNALTATGGLDEYECEWVLCFAGAAGGGNFEFRVIWNNGGTPDTTMDATTNTTRVLIVDSQDELLADDTESASEVSTPTIGVGILADDVQSTSTTRQVGIGWEGSGSSSGYILTDDSSVNLTDDFGDLLYGSNGSSTTDNLLADDVQSTSEVTTPNLDEENALLADDVQSTSEVSTPTIGVGILADDIQSTSEVSTPTIGVGILADDVQSTSEVSTPTIGVGILADDVQSTSEVTQPTVVEVTPLLADDVQSTSEVSTPTIGVGILADDVQSTSEVSTPTMGVGILADDVESTSEVSTPTIGVGILADDVESASETQSGTITGYGLFADDVQSTSELTQPTAAEEGTDVLLADDVQSTSEVTTPNLDEENALLADDVQSTSEVSTPTIGVGILADDVQSTSEVTTPNLDEENALLADDVQSTSEVSTPTIGVGILADDVQSTSELTEPTAAEGGAPDHVLLADDVEANSETGTSYTSAGYPLLDDAGVNLTDDVGQWLLGSNSTDTAIAADDVESASETASPHASAGWPLQDDVGVNLTDDVGALLLGSVSGDIANAQSVESASEVTVPDIAQVHVLLADNVESQSQVFIEGALNAEDIESTSETAQATVATLYLSAVYDTVPDPDALNFTLDGSYTGTLYWILNSGTVPTNAAIEAGGGAASGSVAVSGSVGSDTINLNGVPTGRYTFHAVFKRTSDSAYSNQFHQTFDLDNTRELTANSIQSLSTGSTPDLTEIYNPNLLADDIESASSVSTPAVSSPFQDDLLADDIESASRTTNATLRQEHALFIAGDGWGEDGWGEGGWGAASTGVAGVQTASEVSQPALVDNGSSLLADDIESASTTQTRKLFQRHTLLANDTESDSEVSQPTITNVLLAADGVESASETTSATIIFIHDFLANSVESASTTQSGILDSTVGFLADDVEAASETQSATILDFTNLLADDVESASETSQVSSIAGEIVNVTGLQMVANLTGVGVWGKLAPTKGPGYNIVAPTQNPNWVKIHPSDDDDWEDVAP